MVDSILDPQSLSAMHNFCVNSENKVIFSAEGIHSFGTINNEMLLLNECRA